MQKHHVHTYTNDTCFRTVLRTVFVSALTLLCLYAALWMVQDIFPDWRMGKRAQIWACMIIFLTVGIYEAPGFLCPKYKWVCRIFLPVLFGAAAYRYIKPWRIAFEDGSCAFASQFLEKYNKHLRTSFSIWHGKEEWLTASFAAWSIGMMLILLLLALFTGRRIFLLLLPGAVLAGELLVGYAPQWKGIGLFFAAVLLAFSGEGDGRWIDLQLHRQQTDTLGRQLCGSLPVICAAAGALALICVSGMAFEHAALKLMDQAPKIKEFQRNAEYTIANYVSSFFTTGEETVSNRKPYYTGREVMKITASKKPASDLYLKGFCGTDYEDGKWVCREEPFTNACQQAEYEQEDVSRQLLQETYNAFANGFTMEDFYSSSYEDQAQKKREKEIDYTITYTGLKSRTAYLPYLIDYSDKGDERQFQADAAIRKARGQNAFTVRGWNSGIYYGTAQLMPTGRQSDLSKWYDEFVKREYLSEPAQKDTVPKISVEDYLETIMPSKGKDYPVIISVSLAVGDNRTSAHTSIRKREVMDLFSNLQQVMRQSKEMFEINHIRMLETLIVSAMLKQNATYSTQLDPIEQGEDAIHYFLMKSHKGYCVHFASAAAFMLREIGVPVRYASGYVVRKKSFHKSEEGYTASVADNSAHAWIEIYLNQIGWVPIDVTPGDYTTEMQQNQQTASNAEAKTHTEKPDKQPAQAQKPQPEKKQPSKKNPLPAAAKFPGKAFGQKMLVWIAGISCCVLGIVFWRGRRKYLLFPQKQMQQGQYQNAVSRINRRLYRRLYLHGKIRKKGMTDTQYRQILESTYRQIGQDDWERYMQVAKAAAFSNGGVHKEDAYFCEEVYERVCSKRKARTQADREKHG